MSNLEEFHSRITANPLTQSEDIVDYCRLKRTKAIVKSAEQQPQAKAQPVTLSISKQKGQQQAEVLKIVYDWDQQDEEDIRKPTKGIADFLSSDSDKNQESQTQQPTTQGKRQVKVMSKALADFLSDDEDKQQEVSEPEITILAKKPLHEFMEDDTDESHPPLPSKFDENGYLAQLELFKLHISPAHLLRHYALQQSLFVKSQIPLGQAIKLSFQYERIKDKQIYTIFLGGHELLTCIGFGNSLVFETSEGIVGYIRMVAGRYELNSIVDQEGLTSCSAASILVERKTLASRKFSSLTVHQYHEPTSSKSGRGSRDPLYRCFRSRDPFLNTDGKLELKVSNIDHVRPSAFNCLLQDCNEREVCSLLHTDSYELIVSHPMTVLLGAACAVARIDWIGNRNRD